MLQPTAEVALFHESHYAQRVNTRSVTFDPTVHLQRFKPPDHLANNPVCVVAQNLDKKLSTVTDLLKHTAALNNCVYTGTKFD